MKFHLNISNKFPLNNDKTFHGRGHNCKETLAELFEIALGHGHILLQKCFSCRCGG